MNLFAEKAAQIRKRILQNTLEKHQVVKHQDPLPSQPVSTKIKVEKPRFQQNKSNEWAQETEQLISWFLGETHLPVAPFELCKGVKVIDESKFYANLRHEISMGPTSYRAMNGVLHDDLEKLKKVKDECEPCGNERETS